MKIHKSINVTNIIGSVTVNEGDVVVSDKDSGIVLTDQNDDQKRITVVDDNGVSTLQIQDA
jgi:regulator of RNase E activity RraA